MRSENVSRSRSERGRSRGSGTVPGSGSEGKDLAEISDSELQAELDKLKLEVGNLKRDYHRDDKLDKKKDKEWHDLDKDIESKAMELKERRLIYRDSLAEYWASKDEVSRFDRDHEMQTVKYTMGQFRDKVDETKDEEEYPDPRAKIVLFENKEWATEREKFHSKAQTNYTLLPALNGQIDLLENKVKGLRTKSFHLLQEYADAYRIMCVSKSKYDRQLASYKKIEIELDRRREKAKRRLRRK